MESRYNVFLSYHGPDRPLAERLARALESRGFEVFLAPWTLRPGAFWIPALAEAIEEADAFLLLLSSRDPGPWQLPEYYEALNRKVKQPNFPLVPLLLPDVEPRMPFLKQLHWLQAPDPTALDVLERLVCALHGESLEPAAEPWRTLNPYKGLPAFTETDADFFFGREALTRNLLECLRHGEHFLMLVGNSGVGKSSLVQAGVIAALRHERWPDRPTEPWPHDLRDSRSWLFLKLTPGEQPLYALARAFVSQWTEPEDPQRARWSKEWAETLQKDADLADLLEATADVFRERYGSPAPRRFVLMVDQGEELYTHSPVDQAHRFTELLAQGSQRTDVLILGTLRSDYYGRLQQDKVLFPVATRVDVPPLWENDLRRAVVEPAQALEANFEDAQMAADIAAEAAREPGALPLLSYLMEDMWKRMQRRGDGVLRWQDYRALGGVRGVLARRAENYVDTCSEAGQETLRRLFTLRLVHVPIEGEAVRRRARRSECTDAEWEQVQALAGSYWRLLVTSQEEGEPTAEVAHDVLLRAWDRLAKWTRDESKFLEWKGRLDALLEEWRKGRGMLLRNTPLSEAEHWLTERGGDLNPEECAFIQASKDTREREQQHELEQERKRAAERTRFAIRLGWLTIVLLVLTVFAVVKSKEAQHNATIAHARQLTAQASLSVNEDTERAILLALEAITTTYKVDGSYLPEAEGALRQAIWAGPERIALKGHTDPVLAVAFSPDGKRVATASLDCTARLWDTVTVTGQSVLTFTGHTGPISAVAFSPNGNLLATASDDNTARLWDTATGQSVLTLTGHTCWVNAVAFSPDGKRVATASCDNTARLWDTVTGQSVFTLTGHTDPVSAVAFNPDGNLLATASNDNTARLWDTAIGQSVFTLTGHTATVMAVAFSPDGKMLATASEDGTARLWDTAIGQSVFTLTGHTATVMAVAFSPDGKLLATASCDKTALLWDTNTGRSLTTLRSHTGPVVAVAFSQYGKRLATASHDKTARLWDVDTGQCLAVLTGHTGPIWAMSFSLDGNWLATASLDNTARLWDVAPKHKQPEVTLTGHTDVIRAVAFSQDGNWLATASNDNTARLWDTVTVTGQSVLTFTGHTGPISAVAFSPNGKLLATASDDNTARLWDTATGQSVLTLTGHTCWVNAVAFSPDGKRVATASCDNTARLWDTVTVTGQSVLTFTGHTGPISAVAFSPNGNLLATASDDNTARLWDTATGQSVLTLTGHTDPVVAVVFSPNGKLLATASNDNTARLWNMTTGQAVFTLTCHTGPVVAVAFSPNGKLLATASEDNKAWLWDAATGQQMVPLTGHIGTVSAVAFSPDGKRVATAGGDSTARLWDAVTGWPVSTLSDHSAPVSTVVFSPDGKLVATASEDTTARLWPGNLEVLYPLVERRIARKLTLEERQQYLGEPLKFCVLPR